MFIVVIHSQAIYLMCFLTLTLSVAAPPPSTLPPLFIVRTECIVKEIKHVFNDNGPDVRVNGGRLEQNGVRGGGAVGGEKKNQIPTSPRCKHNRKSKRMPSRLSCCEFSFCQPGARAVSAIVPL